MLKHSRNKMSARCLSRRRETCFLKMKCPCRKAKAFMLACGVAVRISTPRRALLLYYWTLSKLTHSFSHHHELWLIVYSTACFLRPNWRRWRYREIRLSLISSKLCSLRRHSNVICVYGNFCSALPSEERQAWSEYVFGTTMLGIMCTVEEHRWRLARVVDNKRMNFSRVHKAHGMSRQAEHCQQ